MKIPVILGPTSAGKTSLSLELCQKLKGEIISADSRQIYRHMDVGTGKMPLNQEKVLKKHEGFWEINNVKIWGYDIVDPGEYFSAHDFALFGLNKAKEILAMKNNPFLVGGTGLYIDFFTGKIKGNSTPPNFIYRKELENKPLEELQKILTSLNLEANDSDIHNKRRLVRIIERNTYSEKKPPSPLPYLSDINFIFIGLTAPREFLYSRADLWVESIWQNERILEEIQNLIALGFKESPQLNGFIYKVALDFNKGLVSKEEAIQKTKFDMHSYIRRQQTYFKRNSEIKWFDISQDNCEQNIYNYLKDVGF